MKAILIASMLAVAAILAGCTAQESTGDDDSGRELSDEVVVGNDTTMDNETTDVGADTNETSPEVSNATMETNTTA